MLNKLEAEVIAKGVFGQDVFLLKGKDLQNVKGGKRNVKIVGLKANDTFTLLGMGNTWEQALDGAEKTWSKK